MLLYLDLSGLAAMAVTCTAWNRMLKEPTVRDMVAVEMPYYERGLWRSAVVGPSLVADLKSMRRSRRKSCAFSRSRLMRHMFCYVSIPTKNGGIFNTIPRQGVSMVYTPTAIMLHTYGTAGPAKRFVISLKDSSEWESCLVPIVTNMDKARGWPGSAQHVVTEYCLNCHRNHIRLTLRLEPGFFDERVLIRPASVTEENEDYRALYGDFRATTYRELFVNFCEFRSLFI